MSSRAIVTGCNAAYFVGAQALLSSARRHHPDVRRYCFVPPEDLVRAQGELSGLADIIAPPQLKGVPADIQIACARVFVTTLPEDVVVWVDSDAVLCCPAPELWEVKPGQVNVVKNVEGHKISDNLPPDVRPKFLQKFPDVAESQGFNSGVFGLRPTDWADLPKRFEDGAVALVYKHRSGHALDQTLLNALILPNVNYLDRVFNASSLFDLPVPSGVRVVHFTSSPKPWMGSFPRHEPAYYYWLRYGVGEERFWPLARTKLRIWARAPQRFVGRLLRSR
jgi:lipopolysaccharide biosynthesis glycosyltransferase